MLLLLLWMNFRSCPIICNQRENKSAVSQVKMKNEKKINIILKK